MLTFEPLTARIIGAAFRVHNTLGPGYLEHIYRDALALELSGEGLHVRVEAPITVHYNGVALGTCAADLIVERTVVAELKAQEAILPGHMAQLRAYLRSSGHPAGIVINFGPVKVEMKRAEARGMPGREKAG